MRRQDGRGLTIRPGDAKNVDFGLVSLGNANPPRQLFGGGIFLVTAETEALRLERAFNVLVKLVNPFTPIA